MNDLEIFLVAVAAIWALVLITYKKFDLKKRGFSIYPHLATLMWRTERGLHTMDRIAKRWRSRWLFFGNLAIFLGVFFMLFVTINLLLNAIINLTTPRAMPGVAFVVPGLIPGLTVIIWLIVIGVVLGFHEFFHGFLLRAQNLKTKSIGLMLFLFIPGAFVEPDEKRLMKAKPKARARMFAAGPISNVVTSFLFLCIILVLVAPKPGVYVYGVAKGYPAENIPVGARIVMLDNFYVETIENYDNFFYGKKPGENVRVVTDNGEFHLTLKQYPGNENIGTIGAVVMRAVPPYQFLNPLFMLSSTAAVILGAPVFHPIVYSSVVPFVAIDALKWIFVLSLGVGLFNLLPAKPLDGGYVLEALLELKISREKARKVVKATSYLVLILIIINIATPYLRTVLS
ncbi:MAG: site-2 protease family protein [Candidatus Hadarchaeales archaeon]